jgi:DmsE family decaheme c-type cytochrome
VHAESGKKQAKARALETCTQCHKNVKAQIEASSHHPVREGKMSCADCHNPHGTTTQNLISADHVNEKCYECHAEMRGPFVWQHEPVVESCLNCHKPHGSNHDKLLVRKNPFLCQSCHSKPDHSSRLYALGTNQAGLNVHSAPENTANGSGGSRLFGSACNNCHPTVHGSNHPSGKYFTR